MSQPAGVAPAAGGAPAGLISREQEEVAKRLRHTGKDLPLLPEARDALSLEDWFRQCETSWQAPSGFKDDVLWYGSTPTCSIAAALTAADAHNERSNPPRILHSYASLEVAKALCKTIPADVRRQVEPQAYETPLLAWSAIKTSLLGTPFRRLAAAQQRLYSMAPTRLLTTFIVEWTRCFNEVGRLSGRPNRVITAAEVATMRLPSAAGSLTPHPPAHAPLLRDTGAAEEELRAVRHPPVLRSRSSAARHHRRRRACCHDERCWTKCSTSLLLRLRQH